MKIAVILAVVCASALGQDKSYTMKSDLQNLNNAIMNEYTAALNMIQKTIDLKKSEKVNCWAPNMESIIAEIPEVKTSQAKLNYLVQLTNKIASASENELKDIMVEVITGEHPTITELLNLSAAEALAVDDVINKMDMNMNCTDS